MDQPGDTRPLEPGVVADFGERLSDAEHLRLRAGDRWLERRGVPAQGALGLTSFPEPYAVRTEIRSP